MKKKTALIFGVSGQDGSYLSKLLLKKKYRVYGVTRSNIKNNLINHIKLNIFKKINIFKSSCSSQLEIERIIRLSKPDEIYFLSGQSSVKKSFDEPLETYKSTILPFFYILETVRKLDKSIKIYNSSSSECFGNSKKIFCNEKTELNPISPYGKAKTFSLWIGIYYRKNYNLNISNGIIFNHESPLRDQNYVTQKIVSYVKKFNSNSNDLKLGNIDIYRDWGWASEYVELIYKINSQKKNDDYVIGSGRLYALKEFIKILFTEKKIKLNKILTSKKFIRPTEIKRIACDNKKIKNEFNWKPKNNLRDIALKMLNNELE